MELWVRSQHKTMLCRPQYFELYGDSEIHFGDITIGYRCVATYKTKERALEVLDEIQDKLNYIYELSLRPKVLTTFEHKIVYEMPEE